MGEDLGELVSPGLAMGVILLVVNTFSWCGVYIWILVTSSTWTDSHNLGTYLV